MLVAVSVKAVNLDGVSDLTSEARQFVARCGKLHIVIMVHPGSLRHSWRSRGCRLASQTFVPHRAFVGASSPSVHCTSVVSGNRQSRVRMKVHLRSVVGDVKLTHFHRCQPPPSEGDSPPLGGFVPLSPWKFRMSPFRGKP